MPASMSFYFLKVPPQSVALDVGISIYRYVSGIFAPRNSSLSQFPQAPTGKGVVDLSPASGIARSPFTAPVCIKGAQAGAPITEYHPEGGSAEIQFRIDQIPSATPKPVTPPKASSLQPVQFKLHGHIGTPTISSPRMVGLGRQTHHDDSKALRRAAPGETRHAPMSAAFALTGQRATHYEFGADSFRGALPVGLRPRQKTELSNPNGTEQLVAQRLVIIPKAVQHILPLPPERHSNYAYLP
ncbi:hypothetical protein SAMN04244573_02014 [Azotobacter beijerinckii]|uniref:Uncharacterized protein n=1 Tax=Azotobacter beijerinckii TaxID=170623 RepID=A0A1H9HW83_9GAMM|nr:hypothetical protein SAMN04244573_02014 [Azotobacter beijerinckii]